MQSEIPTPTPATPEPHPLSDPESVVDPELERLCDNPYFDLDNTILFDNPSFNSAIVGFTESGNAIYDFDLMVTSLAEEFLADTFQPTDQQTEPSDDDTAQAETDAIDFICYNTIRALVYLNSPYKPIIMYPI